MQWAGTHYSLQRPTGKTPGAPDGQSATALECELYQGNPAKNPDPPRNAIGLVLSGNWVGFVPKTWQPWLVYS